MNMRRVVMVLLGQACILTVTGLLFPSARELAAASGGHRQLGPPFSYKILATSPEAPDELRLFTTAVKTDSNREIITGPTSDPMKNVVGSEAAGERAGLERYTKIMFGFVRPATVRMAATLPLPLAQGPFRQSYLCA